MNEQEEWKLTITRVTNGYIIQGKTDNANMSFLEVIEEKRTADEELPDGIADELFGMRELLWFVMEYFGVFNSHHEKWMLDVSIKEHPEFWDGKDLPAESEKDA